MATSLTSLSALVTTMDESLSFLIKFLTSLEGLLLKLALIFSSFKQSSVALVTGLSTFSLFRTHAAFSK